MTGLPDWVSTKSYDAAWGGEHRPEPDPHAATRDDIDAMQKARAWLVVSLHSLRNNPWDYDCANLPPHHMLIADAEAFLEQMDNAIAQARMSWEASR